MWTRYLLWSTNTRIWVGVSRVPNVLGCEWREICFRVGYLLRRIKQNTDGVYILNKQSRLCSDDDSEEMLSSRQAAVNSGNFSNSYLFLKIVFFYLYYLFINQFFIKTFLSSKCPHICPSWNQRPWLQIGSHEWCFFWPVIESHMTLRSPPKDEGCWVSGTTQRERGPILCGSSWIN